MLASVTRHRFAARTPTGSDRVPTDSTACGGWRRCGYNRWDWRDWRALATAFVAMTVCGLATGAPSSGTIGLGPAGGLAPAGASFLSPSRATARSESASPGVPSIPGDPLASLADLEQLEDLLIRAFWNFKDCQALNQKDKNDCTDLQLNDAKAILDDLIEAKIAEADKASGGDDNVGEGEGSE